MIAISAHGSRVLRALDQRGALTLAEIAHWSRLLAQQEIAPAMRDHETSIELLALVGEGLVERSSSSSITKYRLTTNGVRACELLRAEQVAR